MWHNLQCSWTGATKVNRTWFRVQKVLTFFRLMQFATEQRLNEQTVWIAIVIEDRAGLKHDRLCVSSVFIAVNFGLLSMISASWFWYNKRDRLDPYFQLDKMVRRKIFYNMVKEIFSVCVCFHCFMALCRVFDCVSNHSELPT